MRRARSRLRRTLVTVLVSLGLVVGVTGCGPDYGDLPLPGVGVSGDTYRLTAVFAEALNLTDGAPVKVNGVAVGKVQSVVAEDFKAKVFMDVKTSTRLRAGSQARLRYDTPLGELFIQVTPSKSGERLGNGDALENTSTAPTVENTLAAASLLINGGGLEQLRTITDELNTALGGREPLVRRTLDRINTFLAQANQSSGDIDRVLRALATTSKVLAARKDTLNRALREVIPISKVLRANTDDVIRLLVALNKLSVTARQVVGASKQSLLAILRDLGPIMDQVLSTRSQFAPGLRSLIRAADFLTRTVEGDWVPLDLTLRLNGQLPGSGGGGLPTAAPTGGLPLPSLTPPNLPNLPGGGGGGGGGTGGGGGGGGLPSIALRSMVEGSETP